MNTQGKERWASRVGLVLAMAGNAVGLGNFLRFPAQAAKNGGGAFLIPYIVALFVLGLPLIWVEWAMGRYAGQHGHHSAPGIFQAHSRNGFWKYFGVMGLWSCLVIAAYYLYIETWTIAYAGYSAINGFAGKDTAGVAQFFEKLTGEHDYELLAVSPWGMVLFALCIGINVFILSRGLAKGIEIVSKIGMPLLIVFAAILAVRGLFIDPATDTHAVASPMDGLNFVWEPRLTALSDPSVWLAAAGQIFFTLSIGMGTIHCYASYLRETDDIALTGATAAWTNEFCEVLLGGSILIPIAVAYLGLPEVVNRTSGGSGFSLGFFVFPTLFNNWGAFAPVAGLLWFGLLFFAAITSSLAMGQPVMAFLQQEFGFTRERSAVAFGGLLLPLALPVALLHSNTFNDEFDFWAGSVMLVVFALGETILFAWLFGMTRGWAEMKKGAELKIPIAFKYIIQFVTPVFLLAILIAFVFLPKAGWRPYIQGLLGGAPAPAWEWSGDGMVGRLMHLDVADTRAGKLAGIDGQVADINLPVAERQAKLAEFVTQKTQIESDQSLPSYERGAKLLKLESQRKSVAAAGDLTDDTRQARLAELTATRSKAEKFYDALPLWRNIDRLLMVAVYAFFCVLVAKAWGKRKSDGRA
ncbi:MAG: sodium-dependent transporter [Planctomycetales bacterium]|nr:sodium-dependent transporter [Planctomycetales bacterium]